MKSFPNLNGLRAIAAFCVVMQHISDLLIYSGYKDNIGPYFHFLLTGHQSVLLFFVLSGFLITSLLLDEQANTGNIHVASFYKRRALRIGPLYFLIVALSLCIFFGLREHIPWGMKTLHPGITYFLIIFLLANVALYVDNPVAGAAHLWTLAIENQFYLLWPFIMRRFKQSLISALLLFVGIKWMLGWVILPKLISLSHHEKVIQVTGDFINGYYLEMMAIGAIGAKMVHLQYKRILSCVFHPVSQCIIYAAIIFLIYKANHHPLEPKFEAVTTAVIFMLLILNVSCNPNSLITFENVLIKYFGKISYGIYMFHPIIIFSMMWSYQYFYPDTSGSTIFIVTIYILSLLTTTLIAALSYRYFELPMQGKTSSGEIRLHKLHKFIPAFRQ